jgi:hypothetical protein
MDFWGAAYWFGELMRAASPVAEVVQSIITSIAILIGAWWVIQQRERYPRATVTHAVQCIPLAEGKSLVHIETTLSNVGKVLIQLESCATHLLQVRPLDPDLARLLHSSGRLVEPNEREAKWQSLDAHAKAYQREDAEIEPGEFQTFEDDFTIDSSVEVVEVYSYFRNISKRRTILRRGRGEIGWNRTTLVNVSQDKGALTMSDESQRENTKAVTDYDKRQLTPKLPTPTQTPKPGGQLPPKTITPPPPPPSKK